MEIYLFSDYTGMFDAARIAPLRKTPITVGDITGTISFNNRNYPIKDGEAIIPREAFTGDKIEIKVTAKVNNFVKHWDVETLTLKSGLYVAPEFSSRELMLRARRENESLLKEIKTIKSEIKKIKEKLKTPFSKGGVK